VERCSPETARTPHFYYMAPKRKTDVDYFDEAAQVLLAQFCEMAITQRINIEMMRHDPADEKWQRQACRMQATINSLAVKLRISPSTVLSKKRGILSEREIDTDGESNVLLFGGSGPPRF
jgi:hypothetical protein